MWSDILIFGGIWFWLLVGVLVISILFRLEDALEKDEDTGGGFGVTLLFLIFIGLYFALGSSEHVFNILNFIKTNAGLVLLLGLIYFVIGCVWSFTKWYFFLLKYKESFEYSGDKAEIPTARDNKNRIMTWMCYWPFSGLWTMIDQPIKKGFRYLFNKLENRYDKMAEKIFADVKKNK